ncbi:MFS transporter [Stackebrandtia nassauensis]|uniref:Major facilitator superfamily MFS_1 n=1 Tax=Stackebrandtia nassauensis (strain DSM 44728 / CIP 108903 / NRRL B-16338 / NBRC 102104 / LLR-40K-21) TaxID=446470 RepID=D3Q1R0_STANL|nr:MFS transporter [Stackebrandtia nassauensis]ADD39908.1 major facilitator superfamily MFS_1 [Stackebrandtia nassauensis DSM 44728]
MTSRTENVTFRFREERNYSRFFSGQSLSLLGDEISAMAIPLIAIQILDAGAFEQGLLFFSKFLPALLFGLHFGAIIDKFAKRSILVAADLARMLLLAVIVILWAVGLLSLPVFLVIAFGFGAFNVLATICGQAYIPKLVPEPKLLDANGKLQKVTTFAEVSGGSVAGAVVQVLTAPIALILDAISFLVSALFVAGVREPGHPPERAEHEKPRIWDGVTFILRNVRLRAITLCTATSNFFSAMMVSLYLLFAMNVLHFTPLMIGILLSVASCTALISGFFTERGTRHLGVRGSLIAGQLVMAAGCVVLPFAGGDTIVKSLLLVASHGIFVIGMIAFMTTQVTYRQQVTPENMQGRVHAGSYMLTYGAFALGALAGGVSGEYLGIRETLVIGALGHILAAAWLLPRSVRVTDGEPPTPAKEEAHDIAS